MMFWNFESSQ